MKLDELLLHDVRRRPLDYVVKRRVSVSIFLDTSATPEDGLYKPALLCQLGSFLEERSKLGKRPVIYFDNLIAFLPLHA